MRRRRRENPISLFSFQDIITSVTGILILLAILLAIAVIQQKDSPAVETVQVDSVELQSQIAQLEGEISRLQTIVNETAAVMNSWSGLSANELRQEATSLTASVQNYRAELSRLDQEVQKKQSELQQVRSDPKFVQVVDAMSDASRQLAEAQTKLEQLKSGQRVVYNFRNTTRRPWLVEVSGKVIRAAQPGQAAKSTEFSSASKFTAFIRGLPEPERYVVFLVKPSGIQLYDAIREELQAEDVDMGTELIGEAQVAVDPHTGVEFE